MVIVALSGFVGRYILRTDSAQLRFRRGVRSRTRRIERQTNEQLNSLGILSAKDVETLVHFPSSREFEQIRF